MYIQGQADIELSESGRKQAVAVSWGYGIL